MFVPLPSCSTSTDARSCRWSSVGGVTITPVELNATSPIFTPLGSFFTNSCTAAIAASMRLGAMSAERMEPDASIARITVPVASTLAQVVVGLAAATTRTATVRR